MDSFTILVKQSLYTVMPELHEGFYTIQSVDGKSAMIGKKENGEWAFSLETPHLTSESAAEIGRAIDDNIKK